MSRPPIEATNSRKESGIDSDVEFEALSEEGEESCEEDFDDGSESDGSISSYSDSEQPNRTFDSMPERLTLALELQRLVLSLETSQFQCTWGTYRFVCKAWKEYIMHLARTQWVRTAAFAYSGYMIRDAEYNKVFLSGFFSFKCMDGDTAVFRDECVEEHRVAFVKACKSTAPPDVEVCGFVHDVDIPSMSVDWDTLTITCPWRALVGRVLAEELRVEAYGAAKFKNLMTKVKRMRGNELERFTAALYLYAEHHHDSYESVRRERLGYADKEGDERLKHARVAASYRLSDVE
ncbi:hypothetical protein GGX14DRAFT_411574 [Mycena pura]|uniref:Uncharacterized protein n=1 Tax=Mycena pura TaxID=153505 RepID=A0AAD7E6Q0_9AGAR|nr:hypothetical protein GGX14DRAFT_411574 [Mycena pura]